MSHSFQISVWDPLMRFIHWSLVSAFIIAFITQDDLLSLHPQAGYLILILISIRFIWGFVGTHYARFAEFIYSPEVIIQFLKETMHGKAKRYLGHNPAGGAMIILLLISLFITSISGILVLGAEEQAGPAALWFNQPGGFWGESLEEVHEFFANFTLLLVFMHVLGVIVESLIHKENLVSAMFTGFKSNKLSHTKEKT